MRTSKTAEETYQRLLAAMPEPKTRSCFDGPKTNAFGVVFWVGVRGKATGLTVIADVEPRQEGVWLHVSLSRKNRDPSYSDLRLVRDAFCPPDKVIAQVFPPKDEHVNVHQHCLHLWCRLDVDRWIPDLRMDGTI